jgi:hypothetical protein
MAVSAESEQRFHPLYEAARYYANLGWHVIPLKPRSKIAAIPWKFYQDNKPQDTELYEWFHEWRINGKQYTEQPNMAVILRDDKSQLDFDGLGTGGGLVEWSHQHPVVSELPRVRTGSGKSHVFFGVGKPIQHHDVPLDGGGVIEVRTGRNIAVLPPSIHPNGEPYVWEVTIPPSGLPVIDPAIVGVKAKPRLTVVGNAEYHEGDPLSEGEIDVIVEAVAPSWTPNHRHALSLGVSGWLASIGAPEEDARTVVSRLAGMDTERAAEFQRSVRDTYVKAASGSPTKGYSELRDTLTPDGLQLLERIAKAHTPVFTIPPKDAEGNVLPWSISAKDFMQRTFPEPWWIIDNLLPGHQVCIIRGPGGVMKSWFAMLGAVCVEHGRDFLGHYVPEPRRVLYVQEEMAEVYFQERLDLIYRSLGLEATDDLRFVSGQSFKIDNENAERGWPRLMQEVEDFKPTLVILDPLVEMHDGEENTVEDMRPVMMKLRTARFSHPLSFWVLHHNNRLDQMRGSTSIRDAADLVIELKPTDALRKSQVHFDKARNLRDPQDFIFEIQLHGDEIEFVRIDTGKARVVPYTETTIIEMIDERGPMNLGQLADALGVPLNQRLRDTVNVMAGQKHILEEVGRARQGGKVYGLR